eukprot:m.857527 g.857527  ORF g.857527 m.857527 type:complete len:910 (+) comp59649_c0_seq10:395-3124(+)
MCVLQDFEALTPNTLARTIETVEGGGIIVFLLRSVKSVKALYTMTMDVHSRYRTESQTDVVGRFNERFLLSLKEMRTCLMLDDTLDVLPWARQTLAITPLPPKSQDEMTAEETYLKETKLALQDTQPIGSLVAKTRTSDQAKALLTFVEAISEKTLRSTVTLTAARGRGKSAALGLAIAAAVAYSYSNIFVTSPSPENLTTLFEFIFKGFDALGYQEHTDYELIKSTNPEFNNAIVRVNIFSQSHRQTIQYIQPQDAHKLSQAELVVIDEAAAIPLPLVKSLLGPYLVFMASTINGYEGTGRSLSLKLIHQLRQQNSVLGNIKTGEEKTPAIAGSVAPTAATTTTSGSGSRVLREITLTTPIRYQANDPVEAWLNSLLCLDATIAPRISSGCPHPDQCELYCVNRDTLFSYNKVAEIFLQRLMALYVASHYKNTPNDLQLLSDAPAHRIFCLLGPIDPSGSGLPEILCVIQVALEGDISKESIQSGLERGIRAAGDLIPWTIAQQYQDDEFGRLSGARIVRIATHPDYQSMGYGSRAMELLKNYYEGRVQSLAEEGVISAEPESLGVEDVTELKPRTQLPPLLSKLTERAPERLDYIGVSFGLTGPLLKFWKSAGFVPVYVRQTENELTGEYTCILLHPLEAARAGRDWINTYWADFQRRFISLLAFNFAKFPPPLALGVLDRTQALGVESHASQELTFEALDSVLTKFDLKRIHSYANNLLDYHAIMDLIPAVAKLFFEHRTTQISLTAVQRAILLGIGLQHKTVEDLNKDIPEITPSQILAFFSQIIRKFSKHFLTIQEGEAGKLVEKSKGLELLPVQQTLAQEHSQDAKAMKKKLAAEMAEQLSSLDADEFSVGLDDDELAEATKSLKGDLSMISVPRKRQAEKAHEEKKEGKPKRKKDHKHASRH